MKTPVNTSASSLPVPLTDDERHVLRSGTLQTIVGRFNEMWNIAFDGAPCPVSLEATMDIPALKANLARPLEFLDPGVSKAEVSQAASAFLFRKCLPSPPGDPIPGYLQKLATESAVHTDFREVATKTIPKLFPKGWDKDWPKYVRRAVVSPSASQDRPRSDGGCRSAIVSTYGESGFKEALLTGEGVPGVPPLRKVAALDDGGKKRIVTIAHSAQSFLGPLHQMLYDQLEDKTHAILRGDASVSSLGNMRRNESDKAEVFVSGDYEAATDNLQSSQSKLLIKLIRQQSQNVPDSVWIEAELSLTGLLKAKGQPISIQSNGQLMGNYLSFPLLCLANYLTCVSAWGFNRTDQLAQSGLLKINGDDIVFRCTRQEKDLWFEAVRICGLVLSRGKTLVHKRYFSINSHFFSATSKKVSLVPVLRSSTVLKMVDGDTSVFAVRDRILAFLKGWSGEVRANLWAWAIRRFGDVFLKGVDGLGGCWGSLARFFGIRLRFGTLQKTDSRLLKRELVILSGRAKPMDAVWTESTRADEFSRQNRVRHPELGHVLASGFPVLDLFPRWRSVDAGKYTDVTQRILRHVWQNWSISETWHGQSGFGGTKARPSVRYSPTLAFDRKRVLRLARMSSEPVNGNMKLSRLDRKLMDKYSSRFVPPKPLECLTEICVGEQRELAFRGAMARGLASKERGVLRTLVESVKSRPGRTTLMVPTELSGELRDVSVKFSRNGNPYPFNSGASKPRSGLGFERLCVGGTDGGPVNSTGLFVDGAANEFGVAPGDVYSWLQQGRGRREAREYETRLRLVLDTWLDGEV